jgi:hypothetical protein
MNEKTYEITNENWNPSGVKYWTEFDIRSAADAFGLDPNLVTIDGIGRVYYDGETLKIGQVNE